MRYTRYDIFADAFADAAAPLISCFCCYAIELCHVDTRQMLLLRYTYYATLYSAALMPYAMPLAFFFISLLMLHNIIAVCRFRRRR